MKYCINCGEKLPDKAKFCAYCGVNNDLNVITETNQAEEKAEPQKRSAPSNALPVQDGVPHLHPGQEYCGYRIVKMLNRDSEGVKYVVTKPDTGEKLHLLKLFYQSSSENIEKLYSLQIRLQCLKDFDHPHIAHVTEINDSLNPGYIVSEFVDGIALSELKTSNPARLTETLVRKIAAQLVSAAIYIRQKGLTLYNLTPVGIIIDDNDDIKILISGITYEDVDEREDVFTIGVIIAQLLCHSPFCYTIYGKNRLKEHKFTYITDVTVSMNKVISECLHRNILQRYPTLNGLAREIENLPPISTDQIWTTKNGKEEDYEIGSDSIAPKPQSAIDYRFWVLLLIVLGTVIGLVWIINRQSSNLIPTSILQPEASPADSAGNGDRSNGFIPSNNVPITGYGDTKTITRIRERLFPSGTTSKVDQEGNAIPANIPSRPPSRPINMVLIPNTEFIYTPQSITVSLSSFHIAKYELTQAEWNKYMRPANVSRRGDDLPVDNISWYEIIEYCNRRSEDEGLKPCYSINGLTKPLDWSRGRIVCDWTANGYRLPTEAEWEYAATAHSDFPYSGSENLTEVAWFNGNAGGRIHSVGSKKANALGLFDMTGNVAEWCWDWFDNAYIRNLTDTTNPPGPALGTAKIVRGGSIFDTDLSRLNIRSRDRRDPQRGYPFIGFRVVRLQ